MNTGAKVVLGLLAIGGIGALVFMSGEQKANAAPGTPPVKPPVVPPPAGTTPIPPSGGVVVVPSGAPDVPLPTQPPIVAPPPSSNIPLPGGGSINPGAGTATIPGLGTITVPPLPGSGAVPSTVTLPTGQKEGTGVLDQTPPPVPTQVLPGLTVTPGPAPAPSAPPQSPAEQPTTAAADTIATVSAMLAQEHSPHWRVIPEPTLKAWQAARGLTADGDFGTGTALKMAQEIGTLPIIRGWPKGSYLGDGKLEAYKASLVQLANNAPEPRKSQLMAASVREQGQGYGTPEKPIATLITLQDA